VKKLLSIAVFISFVLLACQSGQKTKIGPAVPDGYQGIYVVKIWKGDNSVLPKDLTGLLFKRVGNSYKIMLSNIDIKSKTAEEIEELPYKYENEMFIIKFGGEMKLKKNRRGLIGTLDHSGKPAKLFLKKIK